MLNVGLLILSKQFLKLSPISKKCLLLIFLLADSLLLLSCPTTHTDTRQQRILR